MSLVQHKLSPGDTDISTTSKCLTLCVIVHLFVVIHEYQKSKKEEPSCTFRITKSIHIVVYNGAAVLTIIVYTDMTNTVLKWLDILRKGLLVIHKCSTYYDMHVDLTKTEFRQAEE